MEPGDLEPGARRAARLFGAAQALREALGAALPVREQEENRRTADHVREMLGQGAFSAAWMEGRLMTIEAVVAYALDETDIG